MLRTFNCGIGMILIVSEDNVEATKNSLAESGTAEVYEMGLIATGDRKVMMKVNLQ
jgi:phosphoribosylaminoimidazole (AIR) synthetase